MFTLESIPLCDAGMQLAEVFLSACGKAVENVALDAEPDSPTALIEAECTNCGHALTREEIEVQVASLPPGSLGTMIIK